MTKYWKHIELPGWEKSVDDINKVFLPRLPAQVFWNFLPTREFLYTAVDMVRALAQCGFTIKQASIIQASGHGTIHVDDVKGSNIEARINVPLLNCENSVTAFYETQSPLVMRATNVKFLVPDQQACLMVDAVTLTQPTVLRISAPHSVICRSANKRYSLTLHVSPDPVKLLQPLT
jgi:hypothetical protein